MLKYWPRLLLASSIILVGCTSTISAVSERPINPDRSRPSVGTHIDDIQLETVIGVNIKKANSLLDNSSHVNVNAYNRVILLTGEVPTDEMRTLAGTTARNVRGIRQVHNELQIRGSSSLLSRTRDSWLTTKVKTKLINDPEIKSNNIEVITESRVVYLMGIVTRREGDRVASVASNTAGAQSVVKVFEYLD